jgi:two-component system sensor histidine kinase BaeS
MDAPMKISIKHRLYFAFLAATGLVVISMFLITKFSFQRSLLRYVNTVEQERLLRLESLLIKGYEKHGNWNFLTSNRRLWKHLLISSRHEPAFSHLCLEERDRRPPSASGFPPPPEGLPGAPSPMHQTFEWRVSLLDGQKKPIYDSLVPGASPTYNPLVVHNQTVGYVGLKPPKIIIDSHQQRFAQEQHHSMTIISLVVAAMSALLSLPLSRRMVKRITTLASATHQLSTGSYDIRVDETASDELGQLAHDFNSMAQTLKSNQAMRRRWVADISHELRTPLAILRGEIEAVQDGIRTLSDQTLDTLHGEVMRLERLVGDLYELSLSDIGAMQYRKTNINLSNVLLLSVEAHRTQFAEKSLSMQTRNIPKNLPVLGDAERLRQLFYNLLKNTLHYTDEGGQLQITANIRKNTIQLDFMDSSPAVPDESMGKLFDRFYRVERSRSREHGGAGLGLALCKNIVEAHNGSIEARPAPLGGLWIAITLPLNGRKP